MAKVKITAPHPETIGKSKLTHGYGAKIEVDGREVKEVVGFRVDGAVDSLVTVHLDAVAEAPMEFEADDAKLILNLSVVDEFEILEITTHDDASKGIRRRLVVKKSSA